MLDAIEHSRSAFEQYHAMRVSLEMLPSLSPEQKQGLAEVIANQRNLRFRRDSDRWWLSEKILTQAGAERPGLDL